MMCEEEFEIWIRTLTAHEGQKGKSIDINYWWDTWVIHLQKVDILSMIGIKNKYVHFIPVIMVLYTYKY